MNDHGQRVRLGVTTGEVYDEYLAHQEKRGIGEYHLRDTKRYVGGFIKSQPGVLSQIQTAAIDSFLGALGGKDRNKNNHRDAIIAYFSFAQDKGFLPAGLAHAATATTEYRATRQKITTKAQAISLLQPNDIYSSEKMRRILAADCDYLLRATLEIKAFSGVRTEEIVRLWWVMMAEKGQCIFRSLPGAGPALAPRLLVALGTQRSCFASADEMAQFYGLAPVVKQSGNTKTTHLRSRCPKCGRQTFHENAGCAFKQEPCARADYDGHKALHEGKHHQAAGHLAYKLIRIYYACWKHHGAMTVSVTCKPWKSMAAHFTKSSQPPTQKIVNNFLKILDGITQNSPFKKQAGHA